LLSWNVNGRRGTALERQIAAVAARRPDLVAVQEMRIESLDAWRNSVGAASLVRLLDSATDVSSAGAGRGRGLRSPSRAADA
jgi:exonuclease III